MNKTLAELAEKAGCRAAAIRQYLGRAEFAHITRKWDKKRKCFVLVNVTKFDIDRLKYLVQNRFRGRKRRNEIHNITAAT